jgi:hypothetical protein
MNKRNPLGELMQLRGGNLPNVHKRSLLMYSNGRWKGSETPWDVRNNFSSRSGVNFGERVRDQLVKKRENHE